MKTHALITILCMLLTAGCGSGESQKQENQQETNSDTTQTSETDTTQTSVTEAEAETDTLITEKFTGEADTSGLVQKTGSLNYSGSEPFVSPTLFVSGNESYRLVGDEEFMKETFKTINGKNAVIYGRERSFGNTTLLEVHYYEIQED